MSTPYLSEIRAFAFNFAPQGWAQCNGQTLAINQNQALFALLGTTYGGNGVQTFALPNLQSRTPTHFGSQAGTSVVLGELDGEEAHTLTQAETPAHTHLVGGQSGLATTALPGGNIVAAGATALYDTSLNSGAVALAAATVGNAGGGLPHTNLQPYLVLNYCIALQGIFPSRN